jgi:hypothetical protein
VAVTRKHGGAVVPTHTRPPRTSHRRRCTPHSSSCAPGIEARGDELGGEKRRRVDLDELQVDLADLVLEDVHGLRHSTLAARLLVLTQLGLERPLLDAEHGGVDLRVGHEVVLDARGGTRAVVRGEEDVRRVNRVAVLRVQALHQVG